MDRETVLAALLEWQAEQKELGVKSLAVFGSVARGDFNDQSDLDLLRFLPSPSPATPSPPH